MQSFMSFALPFFLAVGLTVNADTSCETSTRTLPTLTITKIGSISTWSEATPTGPSTVYVTEFPELCSTGVRMHEYTITEYCSEDADCPCRTGIPSGFYSTVAVCSSCGPAPVTATVTLPVATPTDEPGESVPCETCKPGESVPCETCKPGESVPCETCKPGENPAPNPPPAMTTAVSPKPPANEPGCPTCGSNQTGPPVAEGEANSNSGLSIVNALAGVVMIMLQFGL